MPSQPWDALLREPSPCDHIVQVYSDEDVLIGALARFVGSGLEQGEGAVVIATAEHIAALTRRLASMRLDLHQGAFVSLDAERCLARFMVDGMPDRDAFRGVVTGILDRMRRAGYGKIRLFGEMVDLLWHENTEATVRLEQLWNEVIADYEVCLLCGYGIEAGEVETKRGLLHQVTRCRTRALSDEHGALIVP